MPTAGGTGHSRIENRSGSKEATPPITGAMIVPGIES